jgi:O-antigen ligase
MSNTDSDSSDLFQIHTHLVIAAAVVIFIMLNIQTLVKFTIFRDIEITGVDLTVVVISLIWLGHLSTRKPQVRLSTYSIVVLFILALFIGWEATLVMLSPQPVRGFTLVGITIRDFLLFGFFVVSGMQRSELNKINKYIFVVGVGFAVISLSAFIQPIMNYESILNNPKQYHPPLIYDLGRGGVLRLKGLAGDPNFYAFFLILPALIGVHTRDINKKFRYLGTFLIAISLLLTFSRSFYGGVVVSSFAMLVLLILQDSNFFRLSKRTVVAVIAGISLILLPLPWFQQSVVATIIDRIGLFGQGGRSELWITLLRNIDDGILIGHGLRASETLLENSYVHNSYLYIVYDIGIIGFGLLLGVLLLVTIHGIRYLKSHSMRPWIQTWIFLLLISFFFSFLYNPYVWMVSGIIMGTLLRSPME